MTTESNRDKFTRLAEQWVNETRGHSNTVFITRNEAFKEILEMGEDALPFIFESIKNKERGLWWLALGPITGVNVDTGIDPIEGKDGQPIAGFVGIKVSEHKEAWLKWGQEHGYID